LEEGRATFPVKADPGRLQQALSNLALNACDAMPEGGELCFALSREEVTADAEPPVADMPPGEWVCLAVSDTGIGMTEDVRAHLFEPFFTTKEVGKGTGLGLAQVYGTVRQHEGYIDVATEPGRGTTIFIYLAAYEEEDRPLQRERLSSIRLGREGKMKTQEVAPLSPTCGGPRFVSGRSICVHRPLILLVEGEEDVQNARRRALESLGYRVLTAASGREALAICQSPRWSSGPGQGRDGGQSRRVDLVIVDLCRPCSGKRGAALQGEGQRSDVMPEMEGEALVRALRDTKPMPKVLGITDHPLEDGDWDALGDAGLLSVIQRPSDADELAQAIRRALGAT
jgi:CheY-like chemotaxis protein